MIIYQGDIDGTPVFGWHNVVTADNISATNQDDNFPASNLANPSTHLKWRMNGDTTDEYLTVGLGGEAVGYLAVAGHNFGDEGVSCSVEVDTGGWTEVIPPTLITDNKPLIFQFEEQNVDGVRLRMQGTDVFAEAAVLYAGQILTMERSVRIDMNHTPINLATVSDIVNGMSESGQFVGRLVRNQYQESKIDFWYFETDFYRDDVDRFVRNAVDKPFFIAWAPNRFPEDTGYCWLTKDPKPEFHLPTERFIVSFEMRGLA
jgi:hypothetical protein